MMAKRRYQILEIISMVLMPFALMFVLLVFAAIFGFRSPGLMIIGGIAFCASGYILGPMDKCEAEMIAEKNAKAGS